MSASLLVELLTEELPPKALRTLGYSFADALVASLRSEGFAPAAGGFTVYATPRRLGVLVRDVAAQAADREVLAKGPSLKAGLGADGTPSQALLGFAKKQGVAVERLERIHDGKQEVFAFRSVATGARLETALAALVDGALKKLPIPKMMRWGDRDEEFVRPVRGHRFLGKGTIEIARADDYEALLERDGKVIANFELRAHKIREQLAAAAGGASIAAEDPLYDEVTALVELPAVYEAHFEKAFLEVPQECLMLTMKQNQKYFPLVDGRGKLLNRFLIVSNMAIPHPHHIVHGNERVLRARLADAKFFYDQDRRAPLASRVPGLGAVVFHNKLGSQLERVDRIERVAAIVAAALGEDEAATRRAARLCKADLLTGMVGEFPELQGIMGTYYARHDGEPEPVAQAIEAHYHPRFANDSLPDDNVAAAVALADKLDTLVGIFGIGLGPTGDKDPFALRRHALGVLRILFEKALPLDLMELLTLAKGQFPAEVLADSIVVDVHLFMLERLRNYLRERDFDASEIDAVASQHPTRIDLVLPRLAAVRGFRRLPESESLAVANKRIRNILRKAEAPSSRADLALLAEPAEKTLFDALTTLEPKVASLLANEDYDHALRLLATAREPVDRFFDEVLVMCDEPLIRANRLALLKQLGDLMNQVADISKLAA